MNNSQTMFRNHLAIEAKLISRTSSLHLSFNNRESLLCYSNTSIHVSFGGLNSVLASENYANTCCHNLRFLKHCVRWSNLPLHIWPHCLVMCWCALRVSMCMLRCIQELEETYLVSSSSSSTLRSEQAPPSWHSPPLPQRWSAGCCWHRPSLSKKINS